MSPEVHFLLQTIRAPDRPPSPRFVNRFDSREMLLVVDGSCVDNKRHHDLDEPPFVCCSIMYKSASADDSLLGDAPLILPATPVTFLLESVFQDQEDMATAGSIAEPGRAAGRHRSAVAPLLGPRRVVQRHRPDGPRLHHPRPTAGDKLGIAGRKRSSESIIFSSFSDLRPWSV